MDEALNLARLGCGFKLHGCRSVCLALWARTFFRYTVSILVTFLLMLITGPVWSATAFYYGANPPVAELSAYDRVVLEPSAVTPDEVRRLAAAGVTVHAYVSVGEMSPTDPDFSSLPDDALPGSNPAWQTRVADLTHRAWRKHILEDQLRPLSSLGYQGVFLDTLDSHHLLENVDTQRRALASLISEIQLQHPALDLMLNRGFEVLADLHVPVAALAVESLYQGWDSATETYRPVPAADRAWLLDRLEESRAYSGEIVVIDYAPVTAATERQDLARRIIAAGFDAWVADPALTDLGTSDLVPVPRRIVVIHSESEALLTERDVHVIFGVVFDWLGYVVEYHDIRNGPPQLIPGVHVGLVSWLDSDVTDSLNWFEGWLLDVIDEGFRLVFLSTLPTFSERVLDRLGLIPVGLDRSVQARRITENSHVIGDFEAPLRLRKFDLPPVRNTSTENQVDLEIELTDGQRITPVLSGPWGGLALSPYLAEDYGEGRRRWLLDPYQFLTVALGHTPRPVLDTTTENGSRLLTVHVDGDGFPSRAFLPGVPLSADVLREKFISAYDLPHTVSVIEGEVGSAGLYPEQTAELEASARKIFRLPNVEIASHSFSHPFYWQSGSLTDAQPHEYGMNLPIPGYQMTLSREIDGSIDYINGNLAPEGKEVEIFLWTGSADPDERALQMLEARGMLNVNGGNTHVVVADESRLNVWPQARLENGGLQVYAAAMNENVYTNNWTGPFYGYRKSIETFELTDRPRRLKPIGIYYHFYSATKPASIRALHEVYEWALTHDVLPIYLSDFARRVRAYHEAWIARDLDGNWVAGNLGALRTLRYPVGLGNAVSSGERPLAGYRQINEQIYLHLSGDQTVFHFSNQLATDLSLEKANAHLLHWQPQGDSLSLRFAGSRPVSFSVRTPKPCVLTLGDGEVVVGSRTDESVVFSIEAKDTGDARLVCR